jgi:hypothetical protein
VITFAIRGGLLHLPISTKDPTTHEMLGLLVVAFVAGFSERWAQDTITATVPKSPTETTTAPTTTEGP